MKEEPTSFQLTDEEDVGGLRPQALVEPEPLERVQRCTVEQFVDFAPTVQILDVPVPQVGGLGARPNLAVHLDTVLGGGHRARDRRAQDFKSLPWSALSFLHRRWPNSWWKIHRCPSSCVLNVPVPRIGSHVVSQSQFQQHFVEQTLDIPVHGGVKRTWEYLQGDLPGQSSTARGCLDGGAIRGLVPGQGSAALRGANYVSLQGFPSGQGPAAPRGDFHCCVGADLHDFLMLEGAGEASLPPAAQREVQEARRRLHEQNASEEEEGEEQEDNEDDDAEEEEEEA